MCRLNGTANISQNKTIMLARKAFERVIVKEAEVNVSRMVSARLIKTRCNTNLKVYFKISCPESLTYRSYIDIRRLRESQNKAR